jgi:hypothetical protein
MLIAVLLKRQVMIRAFLPNIRIPRKVLKGGSHLCAQVVGTARFAVAHPWNYLL